MCRSWLTEPLQCKNTSLQRFLTEKHLQIEFEKKIDKIFQTGRNHTDTCDGNYNQDQLPNALGGYDETITFLMDKFNISERESIVLLGAHSVGEYHTPLAMNILLKIYCNHPK